eukprot:TRINITY_DN7902_c0_g1_i1.p1 TRINITY_DN7902_c0_g1~~TRINITY_DN7902_c0_g1_i1.p1  ORF type:complete len:155 (-),score=62.70 TRINITY_DN7902_c0_g1_i1:101-565(-)
MDRFAMPYHRRKFPGTQFGAAHVPVGFMNYPEIPAGNLYTSVPQLSLFLSMLTNKGALSGVRLIQESTYHHMVAKQVSTGLARCPEHAHLLFHSVGTPATAEEGMIGCKGADWGVASSMYWVNSGCCCLLYTSDAADDLLCVDLGGRRIIKKKK